MRIIVHKRIGADRILMVLPGQRAGLPPITLRSANREDWLAETQAVVEKVRQAEAGEIPHAVPA